MNDIKVSVVMPVYNAEKTVGEALNSLLCQTEKDIEIICVDDGSNDNSLNILNEYAARDNRIKVLCQENLHAGVARNNGLKISRGGYVIFLDSDDFFEPDLIEITYKKAIETNADVVLFDGDRFDTQSKKYKDGNLLHKDKLIGRTDVFSRSTTGKSLFQTTTPCPWTKLFNKEFLIKNRLEFRDLKNSNDIYFTYGALALAERITIADKVLVHYRVNASDNLQSKKDDAPTLFFKAQDKLFELFNKCNIYADVEKSFVNFVIANCIYNIDTVHSQKARIEIYRKIASDSFWKTYMLYPKDYYYDSRIYDRLKAAPNIISCYDKRHRDYLKNGFKAIKVWQQAYEPKVSVIIPIYNTEEYLEECLDSIQKQSLKELEIICIDDGSTDNSLKLVKARAEVDERICIFTEENSGLSVARNNGIKNAHGKYIYFMDSDDILELDALKKSYLYAQENDLDMVLFDGYGFFDKCFAYNADHYIDLNYYIRKCDYPDIYKGSQLLMKMHANGDYVACPVLYILKKEFIERTNIKFIEGIIHEDNPFTYQCMLEAKKVGYIHEQFFKRRIRNNSITTLKTSFEHVYGYFKSIVKMQEILAAVDIEECEVESALNIQKSKLVIARNKYIQIDEFEKKATSGLDLEEKTLFEMYIVDWYNERKNADIAIKNVKNSFTFKLGAVIAFLPRTIKNMLKGTLRV